MADSVSQTGQVDGEEEFAKDGPGIFARWDAELRLAKKEFSEYRERCRKIVRRYRSEADSEDGSGESKPGLVLSRSTVGAGMGPRGAWEKAKRPRSGVLRGRLGRARTVR